MNRGKSNCMIKGHDLNGSSVDGVPVVVRDGESPLHGKGEQFKYAYKVKYLT